MTPFIAVSIASLIGLAPLSVGGLPAPEGREVARAEVVAASALETSLDGYVVVKSRYFRVDGGMPWAQVVRQADGAVGQRGTRVAGTAALTAIWTTGGGDAVAIAMRPAPEGGDATVGYYQLRARS